MFTPNVKPAAVLMVSPASDHLAFAHLDRKQAKLVEPSLHLISEWNCTAGKGSYVIQSTGFWFHMNMAEMDRLFLIFKSQKGVYESLGS